MKLFLLIVYFSATGTPYSLGVYKDLKECREFADNYKHYACVPVDVPLKTNSAKFK